MSTDLAKLAHDVGKYISRTARNVRSGPVPAALAPLLSRDLYGRGEEPEPAAQFAKLCVAMSEERVELCRTHFAELATLKEAVQGQDADALRRAADLALAIAEAIEAEVEQQGAAGSKVST